MFLQLTRERVNVLSSQVVGDNPRKGDVKPTEISTFEDLLIEVAYTHPELILLAMEIRKRLQ